MKKSALLVVTALTLVVGASCGGDSDEESTGTAQAVKNTVVIKDIAFKPSRLFVETGDTVTWLFDDKGIPHDVVAEDESFQSETQDSGTFRHTFDTPGSFPYKCSIHPSEMKGTVDVR
ncbi:MAG TPA: plastocyanin/azurin family copper-binding protein [Acidimicrobiales bacterium]|nr:plastocyanin/azurin family copper-binding protein [Acidimicrobiales bacterium]